ncbi:MAG TPA: 6-bladed beta-propeller, partial [Spirochaetia bacterium]|nr:6-bladed beta-propeller [Spirochaetia bacterium]
GPQYMAADEYGYLYVTDFGNRRVNKYDFDGNFILSFGARTSDFPGFSAPTGIAVSGDRVFISDRWKKVIYVFDRSGNFLTSIGSESLNGPESLTFMGNQLLLIADTDRLLVYDLEKETAGVIGDIAPQAARIMGVTVDTNGNILAADFDLNRIFYLSQITGLYTGYFAKIERVDAQNFPEVIAEVSVMGKKGNPIVGLKQENFRITESSRPVKDLQLFQNTGDYSPLSIVLLVEKSLQTRKALDSVVQAAERIFNLYQKRAQIKLISAGEAPTVGSEYGETRLRLLEAVRKADFSESWRFDQGLRMAAAELLPARGKKAIIFISGGSLGRDPYRTYSLMELTQFLKNNYITFNTVLMERRQADLDLNYICSNTGGQIAYFYNPEGIGDLARTIDRFISPVYILRYLSPSYSEFGRMYIPIEAEITLQAKNGYDESGYYAPLQF